jgi:hypothetical protein
LTHPKISHSIGSLNVTFTDLRGCLVMENPIIRLITF